MTHQVAPVIACHRKPFAVYALQRDVNPCLEWIYALQSTIGYTKDSLDKGSLTTIDFVGAEAVGKMETPRHDRSIAAFIQDVGLFFLRKLHMPETRVNTLPPPTPIALVLCDNVYQDSNGKQALVGLFNNIGASSFPAIQHRMCVYVSITSIRPNTNCTLDIVHAETDATVINLSGPAPDSIGPNEVWDVVFELPPVSFPEPGKYYIRFLGNEHVLMQRPFNVIGVGQGQDTTEGDDYDS